MASTAAAFISSWTPAQARATLPTSAATITRSSRPADGQAPRLSFAAVAVIGSAVLHRRGNVESTVARRVKAWGAAGTDNRLANAAGVTMPFGEPGEYYWDPLNLAENISEEKFESYQSAEIKHGRVAMLAIVGELVQEKYVFPFAAQARAEGGPDGIQQLSWLNQNPDTAFSWAAIFFVAGYVDIQSTRANQDKAPGDLGDPFNADEAIRGSPDSGWVPGSPSFYRNAEINHCRLAMTGIFAFWCAEQSTGLGIYDQWTRLGPMLGPGTYDLFRALGVVPAR